MNPLISTDYVSAQSIMSEVTSNTSTCSSQDTSTSIYGVDDDTEEYRIISKLERYSISPETNHEDIFLYKDQTDYLYEQIELLFHDDTAGLEWLEALEKVTNLLPEESSSPFYPSNYNLLSLYIKINTLLQNSDAQSYIDLVQIDKRILLLSRCLTILKKLNLHKDFVQYIESGNILENIPSLFFKKFTVRLKESTRKDIAGWKVIMDVGNYLLVRQKELQEQIINSPVTYVKIKKNSEDLRFSLILIRQSHTHDNFNIFVTRRCIGVGGTKKVKEISRLTAPYQSLVKLSPPKRANNYDTEEMINNLTHSMNMVTEYQFIQQLIDLDIPNILPTQLAFQKEKPVLLTELCEGKDLYFQYIVTSTEPQKKRYFVFLQLMRNALETIHSMHLNMFCHLDIKMENILVQIKKSGVRAILGDFGSARKIGEKSDFLTTYPSPEMVHFLDCDLEDAILATPAIDMWNIGLILFTLRTNKTAYEYGLIWRETQSKQQRKTWYENVVRLREDFQKIKDPSSTFDQTIENLLSDEPSTRPTALTVLQEIDLILEKML